MEHISTKSITPIAMGPSDTLNVTYTDTAGFKHKLDGVKVNRYMQIDKISFYNIKDEHGFKDGIAAMLGECDGKR